MPIQGVGLGPGLKGLGRTLRTEEGRNAVAALLGEQYAKGKSPGASFLGHVLASLPEDEEADFIGGVLKAKTAEEKRIYA